MALVDSCLLRHHFERVIGHLGRVPFAPERVDLLHLGRVGKEAGPPGTDARCTWTGLTCPGARSQVHLGRVPGAPGLEDLSTWAGGDLCTWAWGPVHLGRRVGQEAEGGCRMLKPLPPQSKPTVHSNGSPRKPPTAMIIVQVHFK